MTKGKTIILSNRLPVKAELDGDQINYKDSEGGLATGLSCVFEQEDSLWIGWSGIATRNLQLQNRIQNELRQQRLISVMLSDQEIKDYYEGFSNDTLWPLFHYFPSYASFDAGQWDTYVSVNRKFADAVLEVADDQDMIWIHDYHLMLVPAMIREALPHASIGFFQHIPFPNYEVFRILPWRAEIVKGLLGSDLIGFHTHDDVSHFTEAVEEILTAEGDELSVLSGEILIDERSVTVNAFPMGIDYVKYHALAACENVTKVKDEILKHTNGRKLMISIDRLDYSKGIIHRLQAYDLFLKEHPEFIEKVVFIQLIVPSRDNVKQYCLLKEEVNRLVGDMNTRYGTMDWLPIRYFYRSLSPEALSGLYLAADVALVTPLRDGMNLVCKEYIASKRGCPGVLILSEMAGAARELTQALIINPNNRQELARAIHQALVMPLREQLKRIKSLQRVVSCHTVHKWAEHFMMTLREISFVQHTFDQHLYNGEIEQHVLQQFISRHDAAAILELLSLKSNPDNRPMAV